jgi:hypothetical protein
VPERSERNDASGRKRLWTGARTGAPVACDVTGDRDTIAELGRQSPQCPRRSQPSGCSARLPPASSQPTAAYQRIYDEHVGTLPGVQRLASTLVMKEAVHHRGLPMTARYLAPQVDSSPTLQAADYDG